MLSEMRLTSGPGDLCWDNSAVWFPAMVTLSSVFAQNPTGSVLSTPDCRDTLPGCLRGCRLCGLSQRLVSAGCHLCRLSHCHLCRLFQRLLPLQALLPTPNLPPMCSTRAHLILCSLPRASVPALSLVPVDSSRWFP